MKVVSFSILDSIFSEYINKMNKKAKRSCPLDGGQLVFGMG
ncbi:MAG: hypothetical protein ACP5KD_02435 [Fervidobacterium sp.]|jgi:hypothetical protein